MNRPVIYLITDTDTGSRAYIGMSTRNFETRWAEHLKYLKAGTHINKPMQSLYNTHGKPGLTAKIIVDMTGATEIEILLEEKRQWLRYQSKGYHMMNACPSGGGSVIHTEETKQKISQSVTLAQTLKLDFNLFYNLYITQDLTLQQTLEGLNISRRTLARRLKDMGTSLGYYTQIKYGITPDPNRPNKKRDYDTEQIIADYQSGLSMQKVGDIHNVSRTTIRNILIQNHANIKPQPQPHTFNCIICETPFQTKNPKKVTCSHSCRGVLSTINCKPKEPKTIAKISKSMKGNTNAKGNKGGHISAHNRWHVKRNIVNPNCNLCKS